ncbi:MAG: type II secretion system protein [Proteobacteria bacterium]|nr:type II secretion system protein [Pseudomonadota bacterium]
MAAGFSLVELMIAIAIVGIMIALGMPMLSTSVERARVNSIADFYLDGLRLAREGALQKSGGSRFVLTQNANGQYDWQVDWCFPTTTRPCDAAGNTRWSKPTVAATGDVNLANPSFSVFRTADSQPPATKVTTTLSDRAGNVGNVFSVYFNAQGWVNTNVQPNLRMLRFDADPSFNQNAVKDVRSAAIVVNLSGIPVRCDPDIDPATGNARACSP